MNPDNSQSMMLCNLILSPMEQRAILRAAAYAHAGQERHAETIRGDAGYGMGQQAWDHHMRRLDFQ